MRDHFCSKVFDHKQRRYEPIPSGIYGVPLVDMSFERIVSYMITSNGFVLKLILIVIILTPTVSPHSLNASKRSQKMYCVSMRKFQLELVSRSGK